MATVTRVEVLLWVDILAAYALWTMMPYLTNVWKLSLTHAAAIVNVFWGLVSLFSLLQAFLVDTILGNYWMIFISSVSCSAGLGLLTLSTPPVLAEITGNCSKYIPECIGEVQKVLFYTSLPLIAFAFSGHLTCLNKFLSEQVSEDDSDEDGPGVSLWQLLASKTGYPIFTTVAVLGLPYVKPWSLRFGIPAICVLVATLLFLSGSCSYIYIKPMGSPLTMCFRVFVAAFSKMFYTTPRDSNELFEKQNPEFDSVPHTTCLRCLDKAAIVITTKPLEEQEKNKWRLCSVTEVENTKTIIRMIPLWMTFILCTVVSAVGFTFFVEQSDHMNPKVGRLKVPTVVLLWFYAQAQTSGAKLYFSFANILGEWSRKRAPPIGIAVSMILAVLSCVTAAKVEDRRLGVVHKHGLVDKHDEIVPMTMFWLLPQFILLGGFIGIFNYSAISFFVDQSPVSMHRYLPFFISGVLGVGIFGNILSVFVVGKISEKGGKMNWFQHDLNGSRLDKYYWTLGWLMAVNLVVFVVVARLYRCNERKLEEEQEQAAAE